MTERDRWIIYPLLFLALGAALKDKITGTIECNHLVVSGNIQAGAVQAKLMQVQDQKGQTRINMGIQQTWLTPAKETMVTAPFINLIDEQRRPLSALNGGSIFGMDVNTETVRVTDRFGKPRVVMTTEKYELTMEQQEGEEEPKKREVYPGVVKLLGAQGNAKVTLDAIPIAIKSGDKTLSVSQGRIQVMDIKNQPSAAIHAELQAVNIRARQVNIQNDSDNPAIILAAVPITGPDGKPTGDTTGHFALYGKQNQPIVQISSHSDNTEGSIRLQSDKGEKRLSIRGDSAGGQMTALHGQRDFSMMLGHYTNFSGVLAQSANKPLPFSRLILAPQIEAMPLRPTRQRQDVTPKPEPEKADKTTEGESKGKEVTEGTATEPTDSAERPESPTESEPDTAEEGGENGAEPPDGEPAGEN